MYKKTVRQILSSNDHALIRPVVDKVFEELENFKEANPDADTTKIKIKYSLEDLSKPLLSNNPYDTNNKNLEDIIVSIIDRNITNQRQLDAYYNKRADGIVKISFTIIYEDKTSEVFTCSQEIPKSQP